ncbi:unknown [Clostridium sp. CAG:273]|nr:unknown [Clostridium sp. CAG:273]
MRKQKYKKDITKAVISFMEKITLKIVDIFNFLIYNTKV